MLCAPDNAHAAGAELTDEAKLVREHVTRSPRAGDHVASLGSKTVPPALNCPTRIATSDADRPMSVNNVATLGRECAEFGPTRRRNGACQARTLRAVSTALFRRSTH